MKFILLITVLYISIVFASDNFLDGTKRAEYFEKTDDIVPTWDFTLPSSEYKQLKTLIGSSRQGNPYTDFKTKNAQLAVSFNEGTVKKFSEVTFSIGGVSSVYYPKQGFNVKIRKDQLYGRKHFRIRSEAREATFLRSKIFCDMNNRLGQPDSISANYIKMSVNGEDMGFYVIMDSLKMSYVHLEYGDKNSTNLIQCANLHSDLTLKSLQPCTSENSHRPDNSTFNELLTTLDQAETVAQIEEVLEVKSFMKTLLLEYLTGSWDHYCILGHNYSMYRPPNGLWEMVLYDFDTTFGQELSMGLLYGNCPEGIIAQDPETWTQAKFEDWCIGSDSGDNNNKHVLQVILQDRPTLFQECLQEVVKEAFNPKLLFPHIDTLKEFIRPYVTEDKEERRGRWNKESTLLDYTLRQWEANSEFTPVHTQFMTMTSQGYGLKQWILDKFKFVCLTYEWLDCGFASEYLLDDYDSFTDSTPNTTPTPTPTTPLNPTSFSGGEGEDRLSELSQSGGFGGYLGGVGYGGWGHLPDPDDVNAVDWKTPAAMTTTVRTRRPYTPEPEPTDTCWSLRLGYPCCSGETPEVVYEDGDGRWGVENDQWCGIILNNNNNGSPSSPSNTCWSLALGYPCCTQCEPAAYVDADGSWGVENGNWCGLTC